MRAETCARVHTYTPALSLSHSHTHTHTHTHMYWPYTHARGRAHSEPCFPVLGAGDQYSVQGEHGTAAIPSTSRSLVSMLRGVKVSLVKREGSEVFRTCAVKSSDYHAGLVERLLHRGVAKAHLSCVVCCTVVYSEEMQPLMQKC
jgi:hypothetical protein